MTTEVGNSSPITEVGTDPGVSPDISSILILGLCVTLLNEWAIPGKYWFVMPPKPGKSYIYTLYLNTGKSFEGSSHYDVIRRAADWIKDNDASR